MPKHTHKLSRRRFLKGVAYASALSVGGLSSLAVANSANPEQYMVSGVNSSVVTLFNQSPGAIALDAKQPVSLENINGWVVVKINKASEVNSGQVLNIDAGQKLSLAVGDELAPLLQGSDRHRVIKRTVFVGDDDFPAHLLYDAQVA